MLPFSPERGEMEGAVNLPVLILAACVLGACSQGPSKSTPPMVTMSIENQTEYDSAAAQAATYCHDNYGYKAQVMGEWTGQPGDVTFVCQP
jgi:hypothetical protein